MKRKELISRLRKEHFPQYSKRKVQKMVNFLIERMAEAVSSEEGLKVSGFGSFRRKGKRIVFKPSKKLLLRLKEEVKRAKM